MEEYPDIDFIEGFTGDGLERRVEEDSIPESADFGIWEDLDISRKEVEIVFTEKDLYDNAKAELQKLAKQLDDKFTTRRESSVDTQKRIENIQKNGNSEHTKHFCSKYLICYKK